jgi:hypothetical protein
MIGDNHFYLFQYLLSKAGWSKKDARIAAWANGFTDDCTDQKKYGFRTACGVFQDWWSKIVQRNAIIPFHFLPGDNLISDSNWAVTANSSLAQHLMAEAKVSGNPYRFGIASHSFQDTYSHQGWTGWNEPFNEVYWFKNIPNPLPNVGHTNMGVIPDMTEAVWTDPRTGELINNKLRFKWATDNIWKYLSDKPRPEIFEFFAEKDYEKRKKICMDEGGFGRYGKIKPTDKMIKNFVIAAKKQQAIVVEYLS